MTFEQEWAELKASAAARQRPVAMRLNGTPASNGPSRDGFAANTDSIDGSSHLLIELAGLLYAGRMDGENATVCRVPRAHKDVASRVATFARFAQNQYDDAVVLLAGLAGKLRTAGTGYVTYDHAARRRFASVLDHGRLVAPEDR